MKTAVLSLVLSFFVALQAPPALGAASSIRERLKDDETRYKIEFTMVSSEPARLGNPQVLACFEGLIREDIREGTRNPKSGSLFREFSVNGRPLLSGGMMIWVNDKNLLEILLSGYYFMGPTNAEPTGYPILNAGWTDIATIDQFVYVSGDTSESGNLPSHMGGTNAETRYFVTIAFNSPFPCGI
jgi:hypothetical protein